MDVSQLVAWTVAAPLIGAVTAVLVPARLLRVVVLMVTVATVSMAVWLAGSVAAEGTLRMSMGGWAPPLGIALHVDGLAALFLLTTALIMGAVLMHAEGSRAMPQDRWTRASMLLLWTGLGALFATGDAFNAFVCLELVTLTSVVLITRAEEHEARVAALRYLLLALAGSMLYLAGVALLYGHAGTLELRALAEVDPGAWPVRAAAGLVIGGLLVKAALFPLHTWLPPAHAGAPAPVSAILSALVVKAAFVLLLRFALGPFHDVLGTLVRDLLGLLGVGAIVWGSIQALVQDRIKRVIAYSTVAQLGYLAVALALVGRADQALPALVLLALAHALAKAAAFLAAGNVVEASGSGRIGAMAGVAARAPMTFLALGIAAVSLIGLPPSGGFLGKWLLLQAAVETGAWLMLLVVLAGSLLAAAYLFRLLEPAMAPADSPVRLVPVRREVIALLLAVAAMALGFFGETVVDLLTIAPLRDGESAS